MQLEDWLDDLCVRFIVNIPVEELSSVERICFQIEEAQWFYEDFIRPTNPALPSLTLKPFFLQIVQRCPLFREWAPEHMSAAFDQFLAYKQRVPVRGAILLNEAMDQVLLVKGFKKSATWSFPRGKINKDESDLDCAIREAWEETGYDIRAAGLVTNKKNRSIEMTLRGQNMKLYVFRGVPLGAKFEPQTRKEISKIEWYKLAELPTLSKKQKVAREGEVAISANKFYMVAPFVIPLKKIIQMWKRGDNRHTSRAQTVASEDTILAGDNENIASTNEPVIAISEPLPPAMPVQQDPLAILKSQLNVGSTMNQAEDSKEDKSVALLALLRGGSTRTAEIEVDPQPVSGPGAKPDFQDMYSLHERTHPAAPPSSALPQLTQHKQSLLDAFSQRPVGPPSVPPEHQPQVSAAKQNLLAAFLSKPTVPVPSPVSPQQNAGNSLLALLRAGQPAAPAQATAPCQNAVTRQPLHLSANPLLKNLLVKQEPIAPLPELTRQPEPAQNKQEIQNTLPNPSNAPTRQPAELATNAVVLAPEDAKIPSADETKANLLSLLGSMPPKTPKTVERTIRSRPNSGVFSTIPPPPVTLPPKPETPITIMQKPRDMTNLPIKPSTPATASRQRDLNGARKLYDHKNDEFKDSPPVKQIVKPRDRPQSAHKPYTPRPSNSPRRPATPKEQSKPFTPTILKRPQPGEEFKDQSALQLPKVDVEVAGEHQDEDDNFAEDESSPTKKPEELLPKPAKLPSTNLLGLFNSPRNPSHGPPPPDPEREALLDLLRPKALMNGQPKTEVISANPVLENVAVPTDAASEPAAVFPPAEPLTRVASPPKQSLLDLLRSPSVPSPSTDNLPAPSEPAQLSSSASTVKSTVPSTVVSTSNVLPFAAPISTKPPTEKRQTNAGDKAFLMSYLKNFAKQEI